LPAPASAPPADRVQVRPTDAGARIGQQIDDAYAALQAGDLAKARTLYGEVLVRDGRNLDALLGAGTTAWRAGETEKASDYYYRVLELDPQNASAQAALIGMVGRVDPIAAETRLKQLIAREPSGFLYATLGHVYAEQSQWSGAQQAYFQAFQSDPANPDYAYNLAVGLERVGQPKLAAGYYRQALDLARARGASGFNRKIAQQRLERLGGAVE
jgi:tetratricopeptide (TPR) repeat protein